MKRSFICYLPGCNKPIPWLRRVRGLCYCCEKHFVLDEESAAGSATLFCNRPGCDRRIGLSRRAQGRQYCSEECFENRYLRKDRSEGIFTRREFNEKLKFATAFCGVLAPVAGVLINNFYPLKSLIADFRGHRPNPAPSPHNPGEDAVRTEVFSEWNEAKLGGWTNGSAANPWQLESNYMQPTGVVLYRAQPHAAAGIIKVVATLDSAGTANFLLGSNEGGSRYFAVQLESKLTDLVISAVHVLDGDRQPLAGDFTILRQNANTHTVELNFDANSVVAIVNEKTIHWPTRLEPGFIGFLAQTKDDFRVQRAELTLHA